MAKTYSNIRLCDYGCGQEAKYKISNGKFCCSKFYNQCPDIRRKNSEANKGKNHHYYEKKRSEKTKEKIRQSHKDKVVSIETRKKIKESMKGKNNPNYRKKFSRETIEKMSFSSKLTISKIKIRYPFFSKIEKMRYNPDKLREKEIQVHCKNHNCPNSKEKGGWFTPTLIQIQERIRQLEKDYGNGGSYFYCSKECKNICPLYHLRSDPLKDNSLLYSQEELQTFRKFVLERDNYICQFCGEKATDVHHERPQKLEPFFALDPDFAWSCCKECHYRYGHKDECSTGNLAKKIC